MKLGEFFNEIVAALPKTLVQNLEDQAYKSFGQIVYRFIDGDDGWLAKYETSANVYIDGDQYLGSSWELFLDGSAQTLIRPPLMPGTGTNGNQDELGKRLKEGEATILTKIGETYQAANNLSAALVYYRKALDVTQETKNRQIEAAILKKIGLLHRESGSVEVALDYFKQSLTVYQETGDREAEALTQKLITDIQDQ